MAVIFKHAGASSGATIKLAPSLGAFGFPPGSHVSDDMIINSMPVAEIHPAEPDWTGGLTLFTMDYDNGETNYNKLLAKHGFSVTLPLKLAFIADNFPTDSFTNEYTETFLQKMTDTGSSAFGQIVQMSGESNALEAIESYGSDLAAAGGEVEGFMGAGMKTMGEKSAEFAKGAGKMMENAQKSDSALGRLLGGGADMVNKMLSGHRVDFPQIWANSGFTPSYSLTVRLYNPYPGNPDSTYRHIVGPIAAILCLCTPRSESAHAYRWPFYQRIRVPGLYDLEPCAITNVTIIKGGDQQQIAYNQNLAMVDVRIDFSALHRSIVAEEGDGKNQKFSHRPTLRKYLDAMATQDPESFVTRGTMRDGIGGKINTEIIKEQTEVIQRSRAREQFAIDKAVSKRLALPADASLVGPRTSPQSKVEEVQQIIERNPTGSNNVELAERYGVAAVTKAWENLGCVVETQGSPNSSFFRIAVDC